MTDQLKNIFLPFRDFMKNPVTGIPVDANFSQKIKTFISLFVMELIIIFVLLVFYNILYRSGILPFRTYKPLFFSAHVHKWMTLMIVVVISPPIEEVIFRLHLRIRGKYILLNIIIVSLGLLMIFFGLVKGVWFRALLVCITLILITVYLFSREEINNVILNFWDRRFIWVFYITAVMFALAHTTNYDLEKVRFYLLPALVLPQFIIGLFFGYTRLKLGFSWGILFHSMHNLVFLLPVFLIPMAPRPAPVKYTAEEIDSAKYSITIEESTPDKFLNYHRITPDTVEFDHMKISDIVTKLLMVDKKDVEIEDTVIADKYIKLKFERSRENRQSDKVISNQLVLSEILKKYDLTMKQDYIGKDICELRIADRNKLDSFKVTGSDTLKSYSTSLSSRNEINMHSVDLRLVAKTLEDHLGMKVIYNMKNKDKYSITIPLLKIDELNNFLKEKYGLFLTRNLNNVRIYRISSMPDTVKTEPED